VDASLARYFLLARIDRHSHLCAHCVKPLRYCATRLSSTVSPNAPKYWDRVYQLFCPHAELPHETSNF
jgi:hypothetical protein